MVNNWNNNISDSSISDSSISMRISIIYEDIDKLSNINDWLVVWNMTFMTFHILGTWELIIPMILLRVIHLKVCDMGTWLPIVVIIIRLLIYQQYICGGFTH